MRLLAFASMSEQAPITHWFDLDVETFPALERFQEGPYTQAALNQRIEELISLERDNFPSLPHRAKVIRNDVVDVRHYQKGKTRWTSQRLEGMPCAPAGNARFNAFSGYLIYARVEISGAPAWRVIDFEHHAIFPRKITQLKKQWDELLAVEITRTKMDLVAGDMSRIAQIVGQHFPPREDDRQKAGGGGGSEPSPAPKGEIVGFRTWRMYVPSALVDGKVVEAEPQLFSFYPMKSRLRVAEWKGIEKVAECSEYLGHDAPEEDCHCGIHAHHVAEDARKMLIGKVTSAEYSRSCAVTGAVLGSGRVFVHGLGWRSQVSRPIAFSSEVPTEFWPALARLARRFDVPVVEPDKLEEFAKRHGVVMRKEDLEA